ncbi:MAG: DUF975 family protein [Huintestinicola sp.]
MWTISQLKENAKAALKNYYGLAIVVTLIVTLLAGGSSVGYSFSSPSGSSSDTEEYYEDYFEGYFDDHYTGESEDYNSDAAVAALVGVTGVIVLFALAIGFAYSAFVALPIQVGQNRFYLDARAGEPEIGKVFSQFRQGRYMSTVKTMFIMQLKVFLWSLLFWIPGIIKSLEYALVPYIMAENPQVDRKRAFEISRNTMNGEKANLFGLQLSFIGWYLLGGITCGIGMFFIMPYVNATMAEFYSCMREKALAMGFASPYELAGGFGAGAAPMPPMNGDNGFYNQVQTPTSGTYNPTSDNSTSNMSYGQNFGATSTTSTTSSAPQQPSAPVPPVMDDIPTIPDEPSAPSESTSQDTNSTDDGLLKEDDFNGPDIQ